jgi:hypothetical protein
LHAFAAIAAVIAVDADISFINLQICGDVGGSGTHGVNGRPGVQGPPLKRASVAQSIFSVIYEQRILLL